MDSQDAPLSPGLYLVATPIGNLGDITLRALEVLRHVAGVAQSHGKRLLFWADINVGASTLSNHPELVREISQYHDQDFEGKLTIQRRLDATDFVSGPGTYQVKFTHTAGYNALTVQRVSVRAGPPAPSRPESDELGLSLMRGPILGV